MKCGVPPVLYWVSQFCLIPRFSSDHFVTRAATHWPTWLTWASLESGIHRPRCALGIWGKGETSGRTAGLGEGGLWGVMGTDEWGASGKGIDVAPPGQTWSGRQSGATAPGKGAKDEAEPDHGGCG